MKGTEIQIGGKYVTASNAVVEVIGEPWKGSAWWWPVNYLTGRHYGSSEPTLPSADLIKPWVETA